MSLRNLFVSAPFAQPADLAGKKIIVTGVAPNSIGFETARTLASWGAQVTVTTRKNSAAAADALRAKLPQGSGNLVASHDLDLAQAESVRRFAQWYSSGNQALDVLVNNAGVHLDLMSQWKQPRLTPDGHEIQWRINYLGTMQLTHLLLPLLRSTARSNGEARIVNVVSMLHAKGSNAALLEGPEPYNSWAAYGRSKLALVHASLELQRREGAANVRAYCLHPGAVYTNIADKGLAGNPALEAVRKAMAPVERYFLLTPEEGAQTSVHCATQPGLAGGAYYDKCAAAKASADAYDAAASARLWDATEGWLKSLNPAS